MVRQDQNKSESASSVQLDSDMFWSFAAKGYAMEGVAEHLIKWQDTLGLDINLTFLMLWFTANQQCPNAQCRARLLETSKRWSRDILTPHRKAREAAKGTDIYPAMKAEELVLERSAQKALLRSVNSFSKEKVSHEALIDYLQSFMNEDKAVEGANWLIRATAVFDQNANQTNPAHAPQIE